MSSAAIGQPTTSAFTTRGEKAFNHPVVGELDLSYDRFELPSDPGLAIVAATAEPGSRSAEAFSLLASWAATEELHAASDPSARSAGSTQ